MFRFGRLLLHSDHRVAAASNAYARRQRVEAAGGGDRVRHSGVQMEVLSLYRALLREANRRTDPGARERLRAYVRDDFKANAVELQRRDVARIEWRLNYGRARLEELKAQKPSTGFGVIRATGSA
jgi:hypothetical protein